VSGKSVWIVSSAYEEYARDLAPAFEKLGWTAAPMPRGDTTRQADLIFGFGFVRGAYDLSLHQGIPYAFWEIDKAMSSALHAGLDWRHLTWFTTYRGDLSHPAVATGARVLYLPYVANILPESIPAAVDEYDRDVSFVGSPLVGYGNEYPRFLGLLEEMARSGSDAARMVGTFRSISDRILARQREATLGNRYVIRELLAEAMPNVAIRYSRGVLLPYDIASILGKQAAQDQRLDILRAVRPAPELYGNEEWRTVEGLSGQWRGSVDLRHDAARVFARTRINLGLQRIYTLDGLSDRVFNILAAGGFLLHNRGLAIAEHFVEDRHLVLFDTVEEMNEKIAWYLAHEEERRAIARAGQEEVRRRHTLEIRLGEALSALGL